MADWAPVTYDNLFNVLTQVLSRCAGESKFEESDPSMFERVTGFLLHQTIS
jgi:hypothetical protein